LSLIFIHFHKVRILGLFILRRTTSFNHYPFIISSTSGFYKSLLTCLYVFLKRQNSMIAFVTLITANWGNWSNWNYLFNWFNRSNRRYSFNPRQSKEFILILNLNNFNSRTII